MLAVVEVPDAETAVRVAARDGRDGPISVWARDRRKGERVARRLPSPTTWVGRHGDRAHRGRGARSRATSSRASSSGARRGRRARRACPPTRPSSRRRPRSPRSRHGRESRRWPALRPGACARRTAQAVSGRRPSATGPHRRAHTPLHGPRVPLPGILRRAREDPRNGRYVEAGTGEFSNASRMSEGTRDLGRVRRLGWDAPRWRCRAVLTSSWWARASSARRAPTTSPPPACACGCSTAPSSPPGSSGACEGNVLAWDKELERELPLALRSADLWAAARRRARRRLRVRPQGQRRRRRDRGRAASPAAERARVLAGLGVDGEVLDADALRREEPHAAHDLPGGVLYPGDAQLEPRLATAALVRAAVAPRRRAVHRRRGRRGSSAAPTAAPSASRPARGLDRRGRGRGRRRRVDADAARDRGPDGAGHAAQGPDRRARALAGACSAASSARPATSPPSRPTTPRCRSRWSSSRRRRGTALLGSSRQHVGFDRDGRARRRGRDRPPRRALLPDPATTPARCASTPACAR